ncbi:FlgO family outer membrane protein [Oleidesulfovibrio sp.]|uniref:FlgO family outer membrane protein n=1 Tax=Oleidesulfovibrio sp. TaxID=2909707 RepID=UPI003A85A2E2
MSILKKTIIACAVTGLLATASAAVAGGMVPAVANEFNEGTSLAVENPEGQSVIVEGGRATLRTSKMIDNGLVVPAGENSLVHISSGVPVTTPAPEYSDARELKLKVRELVDQLLQGKAEKALQGVAALPVSFVNQDNFDQSSSFGRYVAEQLFYEFNQRGFPVREYRAQSSITTRQTEGEFLLSRKNQQIMPSSPTSLFVAGTYYRDKYNVFVNARLIRAADGLVLRTGQLVFPITGVTRRMLASTDTRLESTYIGMQDFETMNQATDLTSIDLGDDIH